MVSIRGLITGAPSTGSWAGELGQAPWQSMISGEVLHLTSYARAVVSGLIISPQRGCVEEGPRPLSATSAGTCGWGGDVRSLISNVV